jgi:hypothetical protein
MGIKLFLSHAHDEADVALKFSDWLESTFSRSVEVICTSRPSHRIGAGQGVTTGIVRHLRDSKVVLSLLTPRSIEGPWLYYEMGAAHALGLVFIPCVACGLILSVLPPQAFEFQGADLQNADDVAKLVRNLANILGLERPMKIDAELIVNVMSSEPD